MLRTFARNTAHASMQRAPSGYHLVVMPNQALNTVME